MLLLLLHAITCSGWSTYDLDWIVNVLVCPELSLDIHVTKQPLF